jgi:glycine hydroxymethyltransferase
VGLTLNRNSLPFDANGPWYTSGLRLGTPAVTTLGMGADQIAEIADVIATVLAAVTADGSSKAKFALDSAVAAEARTRTSDLLRDFPLYPEIDLGLIT